MSWTIDLILRGEDVRPIASLEERDAATRAISLAYAKGADMDTIDKLRAYRRAVDGEIGDRAWRDGIARPGEWFCEDCPDHDQCEFKCRRPPAIVCEEQSEVKP